MSIPGSDRSIRASILRIVSALGLILLVVACDTSTSTVTTAKGGLANMAFEPPTPVFASRMINRDNLLLRVRVGSDDPIDTSRDPQTGRFQVTTRIPAGQETMISIEWFETGIEGIEDPGLLLARASQSILVNAGSPGETIRFTSDTFDTSIDSDNDGRSNLDERNDNTNPADASDPPEPVIRVPLGVRFLLPEIFADSNDVIVEQITAIGRVNSQVIELSVENNVWSGSTEVTQNSEALISATFVLASNSGIRLALREASENAGSGVTVTFNADTYSMDFDDDQDSFSNAVEVKNGTNPRNSSDPQTDPCATGQFSTGCTIDTDNDGSPDSVEGASADEDGDNRPDYLESSVVDADGDGASAQQDAREDDPCIPSENNQPCMDQQTPPDPCDGAQGDFTIGCDTDTDNDGEADSEEGPTANSDADSIPDYLDPDNVDSDGDGTVDELDDDNADPCIPTTNNQPCIDLQPPPDDDPCPADPFADGCTRDTDGDGRADSVETRAADRDGDGTPNFRESLIEDEDGDGIVDERDPENEDPCLPEPDNAACVQPPSPGDDDDDDDDEDDDDDDDGDVVIVPPPPP